MFHAVMINACSTATRARIGPRRVLIRWYLAQKEVLLDRAADIAETPSAPLRYGLPGRVLVDLIRPADSLQPGETPAQDARCPALGNTLMSAPVSAMNTSAVLVENPGMLINSSRAAREGAIVSSIRSSRRPISALWGSMRSRNKRAMTAW